MNERKLFFGIPLSDRLKSRVGRMASEWEKYPLFLTRPENYHTTVLFLGYVDDESALRYADVAAEICRTLEPFDIEFDEVSLAPDTDDAKMIWLLGKASPELLSLRNAFEREYTEKLAENKHFRPHVTLARLKKNQWAALPEASKPVFPMRLSIVEPVSSVVLFESVSSGAKREYLPMEEFLLGEE